MKRTIQKLSVFLATAGICCFTACEEKTTVTPSLELDREDVVIEGDTAAVTTVNVYSNVAWKASSDKYWIEVSPESGTGNATVTLTIAENNDGDERSGEVEIIAGPLREKIIVDQSKTIKLSVSSKLIQLADLIAGNSKTFQVTSDAAWALETEADWLKVTPTRGSAGKTVNITVSADMNSEAGERTGEIVIKTPTRSATCTVTQKKSSTQFFHGSSDIVNLSDKGSYRVFRFTSSEPWTASTDDAWIQIDKTSGLGSQLLKISAASENNASSDRQGKITFTGDGKTKEITVIQGHAGNYWNDGEYKVVNKHTRGKGVPVVIVGDGFDREDLKKDGFWEIWGTRLADRFLENEVISDLKDYIDVLVLMSESKERGVNYPPYTPTKTKYGAAEGEKFDFIYTNAKNAVTNWGETQFTAAEINGGSNPVRVMFMANGPYPGNASNPIARLGLAEPDFDYWVVHEFTGHVLSDLPDMYGNKVVVPTQTFINRINADHAAGFSWFCDLTNDPTQVIWKDFIGQPGYGNELASAPYYNKANQVGVFKTTFQQDYYNHVWGPGEFTAMREWHLCFDLGSRYQIYNKIHQRAGDPDGKYNNLSAFKEFDIAREKCDCRLRGRDGRPWAWTASEYSNKTGLKTKDGEKDQFWQALWPQ